MRSVLSTLLFLIGSAALSTNHPVMSSLLADAGGVGSATSPQALTVVSWNMLEYSLSDPAIPWILPPLPKQLADRVAAEDRDWSEIAHHLQREYMTNWHKNLAVGNNWRSLRSLFGEDLSPLAPTDSSSPPPLSALGLSSLSYVDGDTLSFPSSNLILRTFRGTLLKHDLSPALSSSIFSHLRQLSDSVYAWPVRGKRIFDAVLRAAPHVVVLTEYDVHSPLELLPPPLDYLGDGVLRSFDKAMNTAGFHALLFEGPGRQNAGIGIFARADRFNLPSNLSPPPYSAPLSLKIPSSVFIPPPPLSPKIAFNVDMLESHAPKGPPFPPSDRRSFALCPLLDTASHSTLNIVAAHLMTTSRDRGPYPGSVRAGELETIRRVAGSLISGSKSASEGGRERTLFMGDLNIDARGGRSWNVFEGKIRRDDSGGADRTTPDAPAEWRFDTGFRRAAHAEAGEAGEGTACDVEGKRLEWGDRVEEMITLLDSFEGVNERLHDATGKFVQGTSRNSERTESIDYIFFQKDAFKVNRRSDMILECPIPDERNPSDHLPLIVEFDLL